jgi:hypothetical protein
VGLGAILKRSQIQFQLSPAILKQFVNIITLVVEPTLKLSCISNIPPTMDKVLLSTDVMNQPLSQTFRDSFEPLLILN